MILRFYIYLHGDDNMITKQENELSIYADCIWSSFTLYQQIQILDNLNWHYLRRDLK